MSVSLDNLYSTQQSIQSSQTGGVSQPVLSAANKLLQNMLSTGDVISGKVTSMQQNVVELLLPNGQNMSALLAQDMNLNVGETMTFSVKSAKAGQMELNPLFTNTANSSAIMKALSSADMQVNEENVKMVQNMMERGMSIQKDALLSMKRSVSQFPAAPIEDVVTLKGFHMPVNESNLTQLASYKNSENQIMGPIMDMIDEIPNTFETLNANGETAKAVHLYKEVIQLFSDMSTDTSFIKGQENITQNVDGNRMMSDTVVENPIKQPTVDFAKDLTRFLSKFGIDNEQIDVIIKENPSNEKMLQFINQKISNTSEFSEDTLVKIFKEPFLKELISKVAKDISTLAPKEVAEYENIEQLYENLQKKADKILETLSGSEETVLAKSAQNLKANVDFMNQMNQMFQYVQLPLKFTESKANGELYVYGNGKKLSLEEGDVSALLHLDMEHLGCVDIHVEMNAQKQVKTNFYLPNEEMLNFIYEHIDMLNERLEKRGYGPITKVQLRDETTQSPTSKIFGQSNDTKVLLSTQSFDARI